MFLITAKEQLRGSEKRRCLQVDYQFRIICIFFLQVRCRKRHFPQKGQCL